MTILPSATDRKKTSGKKLPLHSITFTMSSITGNSIIKNAKRPAICCHKNEITLGSASSYFLSIAQSSYAYHGVYQTHSAVLYVIAQKIPHKS